MVVYAHSVAEFHPDITRLQLVTAADDYKLRLWQLQTSSCLAVLDSHYSVITTVAFSPDGATLYRYVSCQLARCLRILQLGLYVTYIYNS